MAGTGPKLVAEGERAERRVPTGAATGNRHPVAVDHSLFDQHLRPGYTVLDIGDAPFPIKKPPVTGAKSGTAPIVHIKHRKSA